MGNVLAAGPAATPGAGSMGGVPPPPVPGMPPPPATGQAPGEGTAAQSPPGPGSSEDTGPGTFEDLHKKCKGEKSRLQIKVKRCHWLTGVLSKSRGIWDWGPSAFRSHLTVFNQRPVYQINTNALALVIRYGNTNSLCYIPRLSAGPINYQPPPLALKLQFE